MENYSKHLEAIVAERTQDLLQEKQKTDQLLYSKSGQQMWSDWKELQKKINCVFKKMVLVTEYTY